MLDLAMQQGLEAGQHETMPPGQQSEDDPADLDEGLGLVERDPRVGAGKLEAAACVRAFERGGQPDR